MPTHLLRRPLIALACAAALAGCIGSGGPPPAATQTQAPGSQVTLDRAAITAPSDAMDQLNATAGPRRAMSAMARLLEQPSSGTCLPWREAYADTLLRLHTQFLVVSLSCDGPYARPELHNDYRRFTTEYEALLSSAETTTNQRLRREQDSLDAYRTRLANDEARLAGDVGDGVYCAARQARVSTMESGDFSEYALALTMRALSTLPNCDAQPR